MNANFSANLTRTVLLAAMLAISPLAQSALTDLSDEPISGAIAMDIKPNIVFIMDDSESMTWEYLPDWAKETAQARFLYRFANADYNGLAYNPAIVYIPPKYFDKNGALDKDSYPPQDAANTENWTKVKIDGFGIQSKGVSDLTTPNPASTTAFRGSAFYYTTVPGEYCTDITLRDCVAATAPVAATESTPAYTEPARLRWCKTEAAVAADNPAAGECQATRIVPSTLAEITMSFTYPRMPAPRVAKLSFSGGTVTAITVDGQNILSDSAGSVAEIEANINQCSYTLIGACGIVGYRAKANGTDIFVTAPGVPSDAPPSVTGSGLTTYSFTKPDNSFAAALGLPEKNLAPGENLLTVITPTTAAYPKASSRVDCAGASCSYEEEMTNYANWYAYYRTRMQAMKTAASRSFEKIDDKYRIGYFTINNNRKNDFLNILNFGGEHKKSWYDILFAAKPGEETPLRVALSNAGKLYARKITSLNGVATLDPMQYYCQPAVSILSTDGYWNRGVGTMLNGVAVGDHDGLGKTEPPGQTAVSRPQLDGGAGGWQQQKVKWKKTITPTAKTWYQTKEAQWQYKEMQWQETLYNVPFYQTSTLWSKKSKISQVKWYLEAKKVVYHGAFGTLQTFAEYPLKQKKGTRQYKDWTLKVAKKTFLKQTRPLEKMTKKLAKQTSSLKKTTTLVEKSDDFGSTWDDVSLNDSCVMTPGNQAVVCRGKTPVIKTGEETCSPKSGNPAGSISGSTAETEKKTFTAEVICEYTEWAPTTGTPAGDPVDTCTPESQSSTNSATLTVLKAVQCNSADSSAGYQPATSCTPDGTKGVVCQYGSWVPPGGEEDSDCKPVTGKPYDVAQEVKCDPDTGTPANATIYTPSDTTLSYSYVTSATGWTNGACDGEDLAGAPDVASNSGALTVRTCNTLWPSTWTNNVPSCTKKSAKTDDEWEDCEYAETASDSGDWLTSHTGNCSPQGGSTPGQTAFVGPKRDCGHRWDGTTLDNIVEDCNLSTDNCSLGWTGWYGVTECTQTASSDTDLVHGNILCRYTDNGFGPTEVSSCTEDKRKENGNSDVYTSYNTAKACSKGKTYGSHSDQYAVECDVDWTVNSQVPVQAGQTCTPVTDVLKCGYTEWDDEILGSCPSDAQPQSTTSPYTVLTAYKCQMKAGSPTLSNSATCTPEAGVKDCDAVDKSDPIVWNDLTTFNSTDPEKEPTPEDLKKFRRTPDNPVFTPAVPDATEDDPAPANAVCKAGIVDGKVTWCNQTTPNKLVVNDVVDCTPQSKNESNDKVEISCENVHTSKGEWTDVEECTEEAAALPVPPATTSSNNYTWTKCRPGTGKFTPDTLADVAQYYWATDLRDPSLGNCVGSPVTSGGTSVQHNVCENGGSTPRQFMSTYTLGMGISGVMQYRLNYETEAPDFISILTGELADPAKGVCSWQKMGECNWPKPVADEQTAVDDLWHAAVNGRGTYFSADNPADVAAGISGALQKITAREGSLAAPTFNSTQLDMDTTAYIVSFSAGTWEGRLQKYRVDPIAHQLSDLLWSARVASNHTQRDIFTYAQSEADKKKPFTWEKLNATEKKYFEEAVLSQLCSTGTTCVPAAEHANARGENLLNFLRGERANEGGLSDISRYYRQRASAIGDIVGSEAVYVQQPVWSYNDKGYSAFKTANKNRKAMLYVGANDGMLHAFQDSDGSELWAYVPSFVMANMPKLADKAYEHQFFVDGTPVMGDICYSQCNDDDAAAWKTILVGGLKKGGRGYYALDITGPDEPKVLWEFSNENLGFSYGNPVITKLGGSGEHAGKWVVMFGSGYNNVSPGDGKGYLFVIDAYSGDPILNISTEQGNEATPSGLAKISAWSNYPMFNNTAMRVYGGDLLGNLWRFDVSGIYGKEAQLMTTLSQPITIAPELGLVKNHPVVFIGTGQLLGAADMETKGTHTIYAIKDSLESKDEGVALYANPRTPGNSDFVQQTIVETRCTIATKHCQVDEDILAIKNPPNPVDWATKTGWFVDFPDEGERLNTNIRLVGGQLGFNTNTPKSGACIPAGTSRFYALNYQTGGALDTGDGQVVLDDRGSLSSDSTVLVDTDGENWFISNVEGNEGKADFENPDHLDEGSSTRRVSWRQLIIE